MFTYVIVVAISAFIPYVATPAAENGVKAIVSHHDDTESGGAAAPAQTQTLVAQDGAAVHAAPRDAH